MNKILNLEFGQYYHIYNRGNNYDIIFHEERNYDYFLKLYEKHLLPITDLYVYCLIPNHFHFLLKIKPEKEIEYYKDEIEKLKKISQEHLFISRKFSNFFNAYTKALNKGYNHRGSLFQERFGRIKIEDENYFSNLINYIHNNPIRHRLTDNFVDYPHSSYKIIVKNEESIIKKDLVLKWFGGITEFIKFHEKDINDNEIANLILE
jgi:putative transposase